MWKMLLVFGNSLFVVCWYLFLLATNTYLRAQAEKHPDSISFWYIKLGDSALKATLFKPVFAARTADGEATSNISRDGGRYITNLHDGAEITGIVSVRQSFSISIDLARGIPPFILNRLGNPLFLLGLMALGMISVAVLVGTLLSIFSNSEIAIFAGLVAVAVSVFAIPFCVPGENSFFSRCKGCILRRI